MESALTVSEMAAAFNEWMRRYTDEPSRFAAEFKTVADFLKESAEGKEPSDGQVCAAYMIEIDRDLSA